MLFEKSQEFLKMSKAKFEKINYNIIVYLLEIIVYFQLFLFFVFFYSVIFLFLFLDKKIRTKNDQNINGDIFRHHSCCLNKSMNINLHQ